MSGRSRAKWSTSSTARDQPQRGCASIGCSFAPKSDAALVYVGSAHLCRYGTDCVAELELSAPLPRPPLAQERVEHRPDGLVRIALERPFADGTVAVEMDPLSLLCRLAAAVPPPRYHTVKYGRVLASASPWRRRIAPRPKPADTNCAACAAPPVEQPSGTKKRKSANTYRAWADLLRRTFAIDVLACPRSGCKGRIKLIAMVSDHPSTKSQPARRAEVWHVAQGSRASALASAHAATASTALGTAFQVLATQLQPSLRGPGRLARRRAGVGVRA